MATLKEIIKVTSDQYAILEGGGTISGHTGLDENAIYLIPGSGGGGGSADVTFVDWTASLISFSVSHQGTSATLQAEDGMTWGEWIESDYNTEGFSVSNGYINAGPYPITASTSHVRASDVITSNGSYTILSSGGSMD